MRAQQILEQIEKVTRDQKEVLKIVNQNYLSMLPLHDPKRKEWLIAIEEYRNAPKNGVCTKCDRNSYGFLV